MRISRAVMLIIVVLAAYSIGLLFCGEPLDKLPFSVVNIAIDIFIFVVIVFALYGFRIFYEEYKHKRWYGKYGQDYDENQPIVNSNYESYKHAQWCKKHGYKLGEKKKRTSQQD